MTTIGDGIAVAAMVLSFGAVIVTYIICRTILTLRGFNDKGAEDEPS